MKRVVTWSLVAFTLSGCLATLPVTGMRATGEPLWVDRQTRSTSYVVREKVAQVQHRTADGQSLGTSEVYADRLRTAQHEVAIPRQGRLEIDDEDFMRIAGEEKAANELRAHRETGIVMNRAGLGSLAGGIVAMLAGSAMLQADAGGGATYEYGAPVRRGALGQAGAVTGTVGAVAVLVGAIVAQMGASRQEPHPTPPARLEIMAENYNATLPAAPPSSSLLPSAESLAQQ